MVARYRDRLISPRFPLRPALTGRRSNRWFRISPRPRCEQALSGSPVPLVARFERHTGALRRRVALPHNQRGGHCGPRRRQRTDYTAPKRIWFLQYEGRVRHKQELVSGEARGVRAVVAPGENRKDP